MLKFKVKAGNMFCGTLICSSLFGYVFENRDHVITGTMKPVVQVMAYKHLRLVRV